MEGVPGVKLWTMQPKLGTIQKKVQNACDWKKSGFPGCQPVSMDRQNLSFLHEKPYKVGKSPGLRTVMVYCACEGVLEGRRYSLYDAH